MVKIMAEYDLTRSRVWKPIGPERDGFTPAVKRVYRLTHAPTILGELSFSHFVNGDPLYLFEPLFEHQQFYGQLVGLHNVTEFEGQ